MPAACQWPLGRICFPGQLLGHHPGATHLHEGKDSETSQTQIPLKASDCKLTNTFLYEDAKYKTIFKKVINYTDSLLSVIVLCLYFLFLFLRQSITVLNGTFESVTLTVHSAFQW